MKNHLRCRITLLTPMSISMFFPGIKTKKKRLKPTQTKRKEGNQTNT
jgi:hypothetical protein